MGGEWVGRAGRSTHKKAVSQAGRRTDRQTDRQSKRWKHICFWHHFNQPTNLFLYFFASSPSCGSLVTACTATSWEDGSIVVCSNSPPV